jgi:EAL domain-containing protein (putative c-di-GMP-specific phosphodiesterase class I)
MIQFPSAEVIPDSLLIVVVAMIVRDAGASAHRPMPSIFKRHGERRAVPPSVASRSVDRIAKPRRSRRTSSEMIIRRQKDDAPGIAVLSFDLDRFKDVNDVHGHAAGDAVCADVSERMSKGVGRGGICRAHRRRRVCRSDPNFFMIMRAKTALRRGYRGEIIKPVEWQGKKSARRHQRGHLAVSRRCAYAGGASGAGGSCHVPRQGGRIEFNPASMSRRWMMPPADRSVLAMDMRQGIERNEFELYYQYQNNSLTRDVIGLRFCCAGIILCGAWCRRLSSFRSPRRTASFTNSATGCLRDGLSVRRRAGKNPIRIAVNVAPGQLADVNLANRVHEILLETGLDASRLELEITESGIIADHQHALHIIRQLKQLGVKIAMDDYGTGYSSLTTLQNFPFDKIKIDRAFIDGVTTNRQSAAIVRSTIILAESLGIPVLAEGVETRGAYGFPAQEGCLQVQGYLFGRPMPLSEIRSCGEQAVR